MYSLSLCVSLSFTSHYVCTPSSRSAAFTSVAVMGEPPIFHNMFLVCLVALQIMHIFWFYMIVSMIVKALQKGGVQEDYRSDDEDDDD